MEHLRLVTHYMRARIEDYVLGLLWNSCCKIVGRLLHRNVGLVDHSFFDLFLLRESILPLIGLSLVLSKLCKYPLVSGLLLVLLLVIIVLLVEELENVIESP